MVYNQTLALSELPDQPLIQIEIADAVFVTIWFISSVVFSITLDLLVSSKRQNPTWPEFKTIRTGTWILALWYLLMVVDRWMCFDKVAVKYSYVVFLPIREVPRVASTVLLLWGTYLVVWKELEDKFSRPFQKAMWFAAKCGIFIMSLLSIFYVVLDLALSITWLDFVNVTVINGIASKRTSFEVAMNAFYMLFSLLTLAEAVYALTLQTVRVHGTAQRTRVFLLVAATLIFLKSLIAFGIVADVANKPEPTRRDMRLRADVADGLVAFFYLAVMCWMARMAASPFDPQGGDARLVASDVRRYVLRLLEERTNGARTGAPPFEKILREVEEKIDDLLAEGPFSQHLDVDAPYKRNVVLGCVEQMRSEFGGYGGNAEFTPRRPSPFDFTTQFSLGRKGGKSQLAASSTHQTAALLWDGFPVSRSLDIDDSICECKFFAD
ncbi:hypothetical protein B0T16DRAFT_391283 [Cercophora newfieldiana]|uniref:Uncharacterized protein n=1 Tax=Cercophora newfieldiana TaxID=92897 RepID=A0AA39Y7R3_9PEZI|nr:hypothetical protein B0T16DRAFT_391283 [Cercophora newfieldiana]